MTVSQRAMTGTMKLRLTDRSEVERQGSSGPTPVRNRRNSPMGTATRLYQGAPMVTLLPTTYSLITGNNVPQRITKQAVSSTRLLNRKLDSRLTSDSILCSALRWSRWRMNVKMQTASTRPMKMTNQVPMEDCANACTELTRPARVSSVPSIVSRKVEKTSHTFQLFIMPF